MIAIVDYGAGNLNSVKKAFDHLGAEVVVTDQPDVVAAADKIVLPGVGHFSSLEALNRPGLREALLHGASGGKSFLGICLGMQWLFEGSEECTEIAGAGILPENAGRSILGQVSARGMEFSASAERFAIAAWGCAGFFCLLHAFFPCACGGGNHGGQRLRPAIRRSHRVRQHFWSAISSGKIRRRGIVDPEEFCGALIC